MVVYHGVCFVLKENHLSHDQWHLCDVILDEMKGICLPAGLVWWNGSQHLLCLEFWPSREGGPINSIASMSLGVLQIGQVKWALSGGKTLICASMASVSMKGI